MATRPAIFKWRQTEPVLILCAVRWYLRYLLSLRDVEELLEERGLDAGGSLKRKRAGSFALKMRFSAAKYSFRRSSSWFTAPVT